MTFLIAWATHDENNWNLNFRGVNTWTCRQQRSHTLTQFGRELHGAPLCAFSVTVLPAADLVCLELHLQHPAGAPRETWIELFGEWPVGPRPLDGHIPKWLSHFTEVEINKKQNRPGRRGEKAPITEIPNCDASHYRPSIAEGPLSISWKKRTDRLDSRATWESGHLWIDPRASSYSLSSKPPRCISELLISTPCTPLTFRWKNMCGQLH